MINVISWAIAAFLIYAALKALEAKVNGVPFEEGLSEDSNLSQTEVAIVACIAPLGTLFAIIAVLYLLIEWKKNPFEIVVVGISKWIKEFLDNHSEVPSTDKTTTEDDG